MLCLGTAAQGAVLVDQPYRLDSFNRPTTELTINGQGQFNFVLDTASSTSFIFSNARDRLGLPGGSGGTPFDTYGLSRVIKSEPLTFDEVKLSGLTFRQMQMGVLQSSNNADGILGIDAIEKYALVLDRAQMRLKLLSREDASPQPWDNWSSLDMTPLVLRTIGGTFWATPASIHGHPFTAILDLGAGITIINWAAAKQLGIKREDFRFTGPPDKRLRDMLGTTAPAVNAIATIDIGDQSCRDERVLIADAQVFDFTGLADTPAALIGTCLLQSHSVAVDFPNRKFYIGKSGAAN